MNKYKVSFRSIVELPKLPNTLPISGVCKVYADDEAQAITKAQDMIDNRFPVEDEIILEQVVVGWDSKFS